MTRVGIMQPTYLPWLGYFALMDQVDVFVLLDDVPFSKQGWQQRNRIKSRDGWRWLSVPVRTSGRSGQLIREVETVDPQIWTAKHFKTIRQTYASARHAARYMDWLQDVYATDATMLNEFNQRLIRDLREHLGMQTRLVTSSSIDSGDQAGKVHRLVALCTALDADEYVSPPGSKAYLGHGEALEAAGITVRYRHFVHPRYSQLFGDFVSHLSVVDLLLNEGEESLSIIRRGERPPVTPEVVLRGSELGTAHGHDDEN